MPYRPLRALILAVAALAAPAASADTLEEVGRIVWTGGGVDGFGGFSGIEVSADGTRIAVVSDRGSILRTSLVRAGGTLSAFEPAPLRRLIGGKDRALDPFMSDAEGLAGEPDGTLFVSFEGFHRVGRLDPGDIRVRDIPRAAAFETMQVNSSLEALASDPEGRLITLPERSGKLERPFPVYRLEAGEWSQPYALRREPPFLPVGADLGPDGRLYLLERHFTGIGFATRIRSFALRADGPADERVLLRSSGGAYDNLEGIAAWRDRDGAIRLIAVSDDNFHFLQRTEFVEFRLVEEPGSGLAN